MDESNNTQEHELIPTDQVQPSADQQPPSVTQENEEIVTRKPVRKLNKKFVKRVLLDKVFISSFSCFRDS